MKVLSLLVLATVGMMLEGAEAKGKPGKGKNWGNKKPKNFIMVSCILDSINSETDIDGDGSRLSRKNYFSELRSFNQLITSVYWQTTYAD